MYLCKYIYVHIYTHIYIYTYMYIYILHYGARRDALKCHLTHSCVAWSLWDMTRSYVTWLVRRDVTYSYATWLIHMCYDSFICDMTFHMWYEGARAYRVSCCVNYGVRQDACMWRLTHSYVVWSICHMTRLYLIQHNHTWIHSIKCAEGISGDLKPYHYRSLSAKEPYN